MTTLWVDAPTGLAGDMLLAGLLDLGVPISAIEEPLNSLGLACLLYTSPSPRDATLSRMPSSA